MRSPSKLLSLTAGLALALSLAPFDVPGVNAATVHFATSRIEVRHDPAVNSVDDLVAAVGSVGYVARPSVF